MKGAFMYLVLSSHEFKSSQKVHFLFELYMYQIDLFLQSFMRRKHSVRKVLSQLPKLDNLEFGQKLGQGHFSEVYQGIYQNKYPVAIKVIERGSAHLISTEVQLLQELRGLPNIIQLYEVINQERTILVFELVDALDLDSFMEEITPERLKFVIKALITATAAAHAKNIVHRDIKLGNIMISKGFTDLKLIDWGCGTFITDSMSPKAGSRTCRSPEMLMNYRSYSTKGDIWALGVFILSILADGAIPWKARTSPEVLILMSKVFGGDALKNLATKLGVELDETVRKRMKNSPPAHNIEYYFDRHFRHLADPNLLDLMKKLMAFDPDDRISLEDALKHPYFS